MRSGLVVLALVTGCRWRFDDITARDADGDGTALGHDEDGDGVADGQDNCPHVAGAQTDGDGDGVGDVCDPEPTANRQQLAWFDPLVSAGGFEIVTSMWQHTGDGLAVDAPGEFAEIKRPITFAAGVIDVGVDIKARTPNAPQYQVSLGVRDQDVVTAPFHYVEVWESAAPGYAAISYFDGSLYTPIAAMPIAGLHTGKLRLRFDVAPPAPTLSVEAHWPGEQYGAGTSFAGYPGGIMMHVGVQYLAVEVEYAVLIATN